MQNNSIPFCLEEEMRSIRNIILSLKKYGFLIKQLVSRDFKVKYKRSVLGVAWSLLYPVLMMSVMAIIFSNVFKFSVETKLQKEWGKNIYTW